MSMKQTRLLMDMPITVEIADPTASIEAMNAVYDYFRYIDDTFSVFKESSEITAINTGKLAPREYSDDMTTVLALCEKTKQETNGFFDIKRGDKLDPSGLVKGWAIGKASQLLQTMGVSNFYIDAGGDIQTLGLNGSRNPWTIGIRNPFNRGQIVKALVIRDKGVATSGTSIRGNHIYNPHTKNSEIPNIVSLTVIGPNIYEADRFATAAFAMGETGIAFIEKLPDFEAYMIDEDGLATYTSGFPAYVATH